MKTPVRLRLEAAGVEGAIGVERFHPTVRAAVAEAVPASPPDGGTPPGGTR
jgi:hypothetical protein